jgi:uncharacterized repeat protein (TIGR03803 family)
VLFALASALVIVQSAHAQTFTTLYSFCSQPNCIDGSTPEGGLVQATNGNLYGTTLLGGANSNSTGTVFQIISSGTLNTLYNFCAQCADGGLPIGALVQATNGNLYGTNVSGGGGVACMGPCGTVLEITLDGSLTALYTFCTQPSCTDGDSPNGGLVQATNGDLYGTTNGGGAYNFGTVFKITPNGTMTTLHSLGPFVETQTASGNVGTTVEILGTNLTGTTGVTFNGTSATFIVNSTGTAIAATVPTGATSGTVIVATPSGVLSSNKPFTVRE